MKKEVEELAAEERALQSQKEQVSAFVLSVDENDQKSFSYWFQLLWSK